MTIQRTGYRIQVGMNRDATEGRVYFEIEFEGRYEDKEDSLLLIACAWIDAMKKEGLDPSESIILMEKEGRLQ